MFQLMPTTDATGFSLPHGLGHDLFSNDSLLSSHASFRIQRLGTYLISNLFRAEYMAKTRFVHDMQLVTLCRGKELFFSGERFDQWDLDVLLYCAVQTTIKNGQPGLFQFEPSELLRSLNLRNSGLNRQRVFASLQRLHNGVIDIRGKDYRYMTRFINRVLLDSQKDQCLVETNADVAATFRANGVAAEIRERQQLGRNGLAKWLHGATMVFKGGFTSTKEELHALCDPQTKQIRCFSKRLNKAMELLAENGRVENWSEKHDEIRVVSSAMRSRNATCGVFHPAFHA